MNDCSRTETPVVGGVRTGDPGAVVGRFGYLRDGLFLTACALYALNRWGIKPHVTSRFLHDYFSDLLLIPCALPPILKVQAWLGLRHDDAPPRFGELVFHLAVWSVLFEVLGPMIVARATGDPWDVVVYAAGGLLAWAWWNRRQWARRMGAHEL